MPFGAELLERGAGVEFRVWAPEARTVELVLNEESRVKLSADEDGYWVARVASAGTNTLYRYAIDGRKEAFADPVSRFQPRGPLGPSQVIDPHAFAWTDAAWSGVQLPGQVIYELHAGTFTEAGSWEAAKTKLPHLRDLGVTLIELMPVADFPGAFGWGYDAVNPFAPHHHYGPPDALRAFVDAAHGMGLGVILDVIYNHFGPSGNYFRDFSPYYFARRETEWGTALNYDGPHSRAVRDYVCENAAYWLREYHMDGLRLDATQSIFDASEEHILTELARRTRASAQPRSIVLIAENEPQDSRLITHVERGGYGLDALWNDDFHHSATVAMRGVREAYYFDYRGRAHEFVAAAKHGPLYQGQYYAWQKKRRGRPSATLPVHAFVAYLENHDQVANSARGTRAWQEAQPGAHRALTSLLLLGPWTPLLFQGQEWSTPQPFVYFADHESGLAALVHKGRREFLSQFPSLAERAVQERVPDPGARATFEAAKLDWSESLMTAHGQRSMALHRDLLQLRRSDPVLALGTTGRARCEAAVLEDHCLALRYYAADGDDRLLLVNFGQQLYFRPAPEPLLAPSADRRWQRHWSSEDPRYGGAGTPAGPLDAEGWRIPGFATLLFTSERE